MAVTSRSRASSRLSRPEASSDAVRRRMQRTLRRDTPCELALRSALHLSGLRFSVDRPPLDNMRRRADILFRGARLAVFVDGCFWHGCPEHGTWPKTNAAWWRRKIESNGRRDRDTDRELAANGWIVVRVWAHEAPLLAARRIAAIVRRRVRNRTAQKRRDRERRFSASGY